MKTLSNLYSITIRTGNGINLGSNPVKDLFSYIEKSTEFHIISLEKEENEAHFQGGLFYRIPKRQDHIRRDILPFVEKMYIDCLEGAPATEKGLNNMRKHALKIVPHNDFNVLVRYTLKEGITYGRTPIIYKLPMELIGYVPEQYCDHAEVKEQCSICYKEEEIPDNINLEYLMGLKHYQTAELEYAFQKYPKLENEYYKKLFSK